MIKTVLAIVAGFASTSAFVTPCTTPAGCITQARAMSAVRPASVSMNLGNLFGGGDKKQGKGGEFEDVEDSSYQGVSLQRGEGDFAFRTARLSGTVCLF